MVTPILVKAPAMSTTSLKIPEDLKQRALAAARQQGISPHAFMVEAIRAAASQAEKRARFVADALASKEEALATGKGYAADEVHAHLRSRAQGKPGNKPKAKTWRA
jgi:predicted transcriptional regulator